ncbi:MAG: Ferric aerobactin receptor [Burkholderia lata]|uniref:Ferric aerobactin receptor n=1 Tax=Burkholderia lata (strain ATCC 17760 / DSM 23089 / LMG 22485 / NCIMB 9086 / R18194 / 383) TaxID=482957 RepID=A0A833PZL8_BURL3|nr:TonB-dependent siderophore receptor [Burkholderia lata]KAF1039439.1 MAG: Ferric aerobactin receptor [Burkholderia lata]
MGGNGHQGGVGRVVCIAVASCLSAAAWGQGGDVSSFDIPAQRLDRALNAFARQSGAQLLFSTSSAEQRTSQAIKGRLTAAAALAQLLSGSGLHARATGRNTFTVESGAPAAPLKTDSGAGASADVGAAASVNAGADVSATASRAAEPVELAAIEVSGDRTHSDLVRPTRQITVIGRDTLRDLEAGSNNLATVLSKAVPGMADSSHTMTDYGQTLRGRNILVLVDGVPLNTNRDSARNLANVDPNNIEKVEVLRGSSAVYGAGATGGIVSITTRQPGGAPRAETTFSMTSPLSHLGSGGLGGTVQQFFAGSHGPVEYEFNVDAQHIGSAYDARGHRIAPEPSQGDLFDSNVYNVEGKLGFRIDANQRIVFSASHYDAKQDTRYGSDPSVAKLTPGTTVARPKDGLQLDDQNRIRNTQLNLQYSNKDVLGSEVAAQLYYRNYFTRFAPFDARAVATRGNNVDQVMQDSKVFGSRLTITTPLDRAGRTKIQWGADFNQERSDMPDDIFSSAAYDASGGLVYRKTGTLTYLPTLTATSVGGFAQLQHKFSDKWSAEAGVRYEHASASFDSFVPLSQLRLAKKYTVPGGSTGYGAWLFNAGVAYAPVPSQEIYASFSQGFQLPDVGLQLRNATAGFDIHSSSLEPVKTNNYEIGWRGSLGNHADGTLALFYTTSELGDVQSFNNGLILTRTAERIAGIEATVDYASDDDKWGAGGTITYMQGRERPQNSANFQDMTGYRIPPLKLTGYLEYRPNPRWSNRLQATFYAARDYRLNDKIGFGRMDVGSYTTVDLISRYQITKKDRVTVGVENLLNRYYLPLYSQLMRNSNNTSRLPAAGAVLTASYTHRW